jgi:hypothetical protein
MYCKEEVPSLTSDNRKRQRLAAGVAFHVVASVGIIPSKI